MDVQQRINKVKGLQEIKDQAMKMADEGAEALEVRQFVSEGAKRMAYENPDEDAFRKAASATFAYKEKKAKKSSSQPQGRPFTDESFQPQGRRFADGSF